MNTSIEFHVYELLKKYNLTLTTAESATGGMIASMLVNVPGISEYFCEGYVTYSNDAKVKMIGVNRNLIDTYGVVSKEVAKDMAVSAARTAGTDAALSVTGIAGPTGGTEEKPVGLVYIGVSDKNGCEVYRFVQHGDRERVRNKSALCALDIILKRIKKH